MINVIRGIIPILPTPLLENGDVDKTSNVRLVDFLIEKGAAGIIILGSASENFQLDIDQRIDVVYSAAEGCKGRIPLIAGCSNLAPRNVLRFFKEVEKANLAALYYIPYDVKLGEERLIHMLKTYCDKSPFPFYLYHNIKRGRAITMNVAQELKAHANCWGLKVGGYNLNEMQNFMTLDDDEFQVMGSGGGQIYAWLALGARTSTGSPMACFPEQFKKLYDIFMEGNIEEARKIQLWWKTFHSNIPNTAPENGEYAAEEKYILVKRGIIKYETCHFPYRKLTEDEKAQIDKAMKELGTLYKD